MKTICTIAMAMILGLSATAQKSAVLKFNLENNKTYRLKYSSSENKTTSMQGMEQSGATNTNMVLSLKPVSQKEDFFIAQMKFDTMIISNTTPPMTISSVEKGDLNSSDPVQAITCLINRLCNSELAVKLTYTGQVIEIINFDAVSQNIFDGIEALPPQTKMMVTMQANMMISRDMLKGMIESSISYLPGKAVKKGDKWETSFEIASGGLGMVTTNNYTLDQLTKTQAVLSGSTILKPASDEPVNMGGAMITNKMSGMGKVNYTIDPVTGWIIKGSFKNQVSGSMQMNAQGQNMDIPVESISETTITAL